MPRSPIVIPLAFTIGLHTLVGAVLLWGMPIMEPPVHKKPLPVVQAKVMSLEQAAPKKAPQPKAAPKPKPKPAPKPQPQPTAKPKPKPAPKPSVDLAKKKKLEEQKREAERRRQQEEQERREEQRRLEEQRQRELQRKRELLTEALAEEEAELQAVRDGQLVSSYVVAIRRAIIANWSRPPSARNDMKAELLIQLVPTGEVVSATVVRSSGNAAFDRSAENAVMKAARFPELQELKGNRVFEQNFRRLRIVFNPEDLRR